MDIFNIFIQLGLLLLSVGSLLLLSQFLGRVFNMLYLPPVIGEICSGLILGPSFLGFLSQEFHASLFKNFLVQEKIFSFFYWIGPILLMLCAGFKIQNFSNSDDKKFIYNLIIASTFLPILGGIFYYNLYDFTKYKGNSGTDLSLSIIVIVSMAITSIPIISKIFIDLNIIHTRFAKIVLITATFHDLLLWVALDFAIKNIEKGYINIIATTFISILFLLVSFFIGPHLANLAKEINKKINISNFSFFYIFFICFFMTIISHYLNINLIFSALMAGIIVGTLPEKDFRSSKEMISKISLSFFIPLYFSLVGLKINLPAYFDWKLFLSFLTVSSLLEIGSVLIGLRLLSKDWFTNLNFGVAMNARGGPGIIIASMAYEFSIIDEKLFVVLVLAAMATSLISGVWFKFVLNQRGFLYI